MKKFIFLLIIILGINLNLKADPSDDIMKIQKEIDERISRQKVVENLKAEINFLIFRPDDIIDADILMGQILELQRKIDRSLSPQK